MKNSFHKFRVVAIGTFLAVLFASSGAKAFYITNYGDFAATTVSFNQVTESSITESIALYRDPIVSANSLVFNPHLFGAYAAGVGGYDKTDGQLSLTIKANTNATIPTIKFWERGDFSMSGPGTTNTYVDVTANFNITVLAVGGVSVTPVNFGGSMVFTPNANGTFDLPTYPAPYGPGQNQWLGVFYFDLGAALANLGYTQGATEVRLSLDNTLIARSESGTDALILKKEIAGSVGLEVIVPEPTAFTLVLFGGLAMLRRVRKADRI